MALNDVMARLAAGISPAAAPKSNPEPQGYGETDDPLTKKTIGRCAVHQCGELLCTIGQADKRIKELVVNLHAN